MYSHAHDFAYADAWCVMHVFFLGGGCGLLCICVCRVWSQGKKLGDLAQEWERQRWWRQPSHCRTLSSVGQIKERCNKKTIQIERKQFERSKLLQSKASIWKKKTEKQKLVFSEFRPKDYVVRICLSSFHPAGTVVVFLPCSFVGCLHCRSSLFCIESVSYRTPDTSDRGTFHVFYNKTHEMSPYVEPYVRSNLKP